VCQIKIFNTATEYEWAESQKPKNGRKKEKGIREVEERKE